MAFLAIITVFLLVQFWISGGPTQNDNWFFAFSRWLASASFSDREPPTLHLVFAVLLPVAGMVMLECLLGGVLFGLPTLLLMIVVLLYSLGRGNFNAQLKEYRSHWKSGDVQAAYHIAQGFSHSETIETSDNIADLHKHTIEAVLYQGFERWFAVVFWFVFFGPAGALGYRLVYLYADSSDELMRRNLTKANRCLFVLEWLPVRLLGLTFAFAGNFASCISSWRKHLLDDQGKTQTTLRELGLAALGEREQVACQGPCNDSEREQLIDDGDSQIAALSDLLERAAIVWIVAIALGIILT